MARVKRAQPSSGGEASFAAMMSFATVAATGTTMPLTMLANPPGSGKTAFVKRVVGQAVSGGATAASVQLALTSATFTIYNLQSPLEEFSPVSLNRAGASVCKCIRPIAGTAVASYTNVISGVSSPITIMRLAFSRLRTNQRKPRTLVHDFPADIVLPPGRAIWFTPATAWIGGDLRGFMLWTEQ